MGFLKRPFKHLVIIGHSQQQDTGPSGSQVQTSFMILMTLTILNGKILNCSPKNTLGECLCKKKKVSKELYKYANVTTLYSSYFIMLFNSFFCMT